jgi:ABC-type transporter Mla subunit MlaD
MIETAVKKPPAAEAQTHSNLIDRVQGCTRQVATLDARVRELISRVDLMEARSRVVAQASDHLTDLCNRLEKTVQLLNERQDSPDRTH